MSTLEKRAIMSLRIIKVVSEEAKQLLTKIKLTNGIDNIIQNIDIKTDRIWIECDNVLKEYESRQKRLDEKENLSKDAKK